MADNAITLGEVFKDLAFHQFLAARAHYVMARIAVLSPAHGGVDILLSQQTIELYVKAIRRQRGDPGGARGRGKHELIRLLNSTCPPRPAYFDSLLADHAKRKFLTTLSTGYHKVRYREQGYGINLSRVTADLDELVINLKTAKAFGLNMPPSLLLRADQVIE